VSKIDMTAVMRDPIVAGELFNVIRREETISQHGRPEIGEILYKDVVGSVGPTGSNSLVREEAFSTQTNTIKVITPFMLRGPSKDKARGARRNFQPDLIEWNGSFYVVSTIDNFGAFGQGMCSADCMSIDYTDDAPKNRKIVQI